MLSFSEVLIGFRIALPSFFNRILRPTPSLLNLSKEGEKVGVSKLGLYQPTHPAAPQLRDRELPPKKVRGLSTIARSHDTSGPWWYAR